MCLSLKGCKRAHASYSQPPFPAMPSSKFTYDLPAGAPSSFLREDGIESGFIRHTTGSGKTLISFKASTLLKENDHIRRCVFVVDRKDLNRQKREDFNRFCPKEELVLANGSRTSNQTGEGNFECAFWMKTSSLSQLAIA